MNELVENATDSLLNTGSALEADSWSALMNSEY